MEPIPFAIKDKALIPPTGYDRITAGYGTRTRMGTQVSRFPVPMV